MKNLANMLDRRRNGTQLRLGEESKLERVLVVCFNRTLVPLLKKMLDAACAELMHTGIPEHVDVLHMAGLESAIAWQRLKSLFRYLPYGEKVSVVSKTGF